ncbi:MAG: hypothetical protein MJ073_03610 [Oscillibacter sp.]|nr:hypothetical protein [Oscillibacter sp.]
MGQSFFVGLTLENDFWKVAFEGKSPQNLLKPFSEHKELIFGILNVLIVSIKKFPQRLVAMRLKAGVSIIWANCFRPDNCTGGVLQRTCGWKQFRCLFVISKILYIWEISALSSIVPFCASAKQWAFCMGVMEKFFLTKHCRFLSKEKRHSPATI